MSRRLFSDVDRMIGDLLDRYDANPGASRLLAYVDEEGFASAEASDRFHRKLEAAQAEGGLSIERRRVDGRVVIAHVRLNEPEKLFAYARRIPASARSSIALRTACARTDLPEAAQRILGDIHQGWAKGVRRFDLRPGDEEGLGMALDLCLSLKNRIEQAHDTPVDYRTFSKSARVESKALESFLGPVMKIFERLYPEHAATQVIDPENKLALLGIVRTPQALTLSGALAIDGQPLPDLNYYGVPPEQADRLSLCSPVSYVLTIENYTSFVRHVRDINADRKALIIYTGGFPARAHLAQILRLSDAARCPVFHWGDIDIGGLRIFAHLETALAHHGIALQPHLMNDNVLNAFGFTPKRPLFENRARTGGALDALWDTIMKRQIVMEQESLSPEDPLAISDVIVSI